MGRGLALGHPPRVLALNLSGVYGAHAHRHATMTGMPEPLRSGDPRNVGVYAIQGRLGEGGQGVVFLASGPAGELVAIKVLRPEIASDPVARRRLAREIAGAQAIARFCTARVLDFSVPQVPDDPDPDGSEPLAVAGASPNSGAPGRLGEPEEGVGRQGSEPAYIVTEYVDGPSLQRLVTTDGPRSGGGLERLAVNTATALVAIHEARVVHRDLKPANVLIGLDGARVVDFGIARASESAGIDTSAESITATGSVLGTPAYMAPEQFLPAPDGEVGPAASVWAWAATVVYAATGRPPFGTEAPPVVMQRVLNEEPDLGAAGRLPEPLGSLLPACLAKDPRARPTSAQVLNRMLAREPSPAPAAFSAVTTKQDGTGGDKATAVGTAADGSARRRPAALAVVGLIAMAIVALLLVPWWLDRSGDPDPPPGGEDATSGSDVNGTGQEQDREPPLVTPPSTGVLPGTDTSIRLALEGPVTLVGYSVRTTDFFGNPNYILDAESGSYVEQDGIFDTELISPDGRRSAVMVQLTDVPDLEIVDRGSGDRNSVELPEGRFINPQWSSDGSRLLLTWMGVEEANIRGFVIIDTEAAVDTERDETATDGDEGGDDLLEIGEPAVVRAAGTGFYWTRGRNGVVTNDSDGNVIFYSVAGRESARRDGLGKLGGSGLGPVSPDGKRLLTQCPADEVDGDDAGEKAETGFPATHICLWDVSSGGLISKRAISRDGSVPRNQVLGWYDNERYLMNWSDRPELWSVALAPLNQREPAELLTEGPDDTDFRFAPVPTASS